MKFKSLSLLLALCAGLTGLSAHAGGKPATLGGSSNIVGNIFAPNNNQNEPSGGSIGANAITVAPAVLNPAAPSQGRYVLISPLVVQPLRVMFGLTAPGPNAAGAVNNFSSNIRSILPALNSVSVYMGPALPPVNLGASVQSTLAAPNMNGILNVLQLTIIALQQNPNNPAVLQFARQLMGTYNLVSG